jgi:hypothetical protein
MPQPELTDEQLQEAVDLVARWGTVTKAAKQSEYSRSTLLHRHMKGCSLGFKPTVIPYATTARPYERLGRVHMVIPDIQAKPNVEHEHMRWIANYALEKRPDVIVQIGDWADMPSLSLYDKGKRCYEGRRYVKDIEAANFSLNLFEETIENHNREHPEDRYEPRKVITFGNHEYRIERATMLDASLDGKLTIERPRFQGAVGSATTSSRSSDRRHPVFALLHFRCYGESGLVPRRRYLRLAAGPPRWATFSEWTLPTTPKRSRSALCAGPVTSTTRTISGRRATTPRGKSS